MKWSSQNQKIETPQLTKGTLKGLLWGKCRPIHREFTNGKCPEFALYL
jgi:hypothetical protein